MAKVFLDPKTAKTFVHGMLKTADKNLNESCIKPVSARAQKQVKRMAEVEHAVKSLLGECLLGSLWSGRMFACWGIEPVSPNESARPYHGILRYLTYNTRSDVSRDVDIVEVSTHAMERILQRQPEGNLLKALANEFTYDFINNYIDTVLNLPEKDVASKVKLEFKVNTTTGVACIVVDATRNTLAVITTWYRRTGDQDGN